MTTRRSFLRNLIAAVMLSPVVARLVEEIPIPTDIIHTPTMVFYAIDPNPLRFNFVNGEYNRVQ